jgi:hypothetical protein
MVCLIGSLPVFRENACSDNCIVALIAEFNNTHPSQVEALFGCSDSARAVRLHGAFRVHLELLGHLNLLKSGIAQP